MKILERIKKGFNRFWNEGLGEDIKVIIYTPDVKLALEASENGTIADLEQEQQQFEAATPKSENKFAKGFRVNTSVGRIPEVRDSVGHSQDINKQEQSKQVRNEGRDSK